MISLKRATLPKLWISGDAVHGPEIKLRLPCGLSNFSRKIGRCVSWHHGPFARRVGLDPDLSQITARRVVAHHSQDEGLQVGFRNQYHSRSCPCRVETCRGGDGSSATVVPLPRWCRRAPAHDLRSAAHLCRDGSPIELLPTHVRKARASTDPRLRAMQDV